MQKHLLIKLLLPPLYWRPAGQPSHVAQPAASVEGNKSVTLGRWFIESQQCKRLLQAWFLSLATGRALSLCHSSRAEPSSCLPASTYRVGDLWWLWSDYHFAFWFSFWHPEMFVLFELPAITFWFSCISFSFWSRMRRSESSQDGNWKYYFGCKSGSRSSPFRSVRSSTSLLQPLLEVPHLSCLNPSPPHPLHDCTAVHTGQSAPVSLPCSCCSWNDLVPNNCMSHLLLLC